LEKREEDNEEEAIHENQNDLGGLFLMNIL
jgi:hypothetical protein